MIRAMWPGVCIRCEETYARGALIVSWQGGYIHSTCGSGADDE